MAENKKSFVAYCEWQESFNELSDEEAGILIKHIFAYVNDENPVCDVKIVKMCFIPIKQTLKRDLKKYECYLEKQRVNGAKGGRPAKTQKTQRLKNKPKKADSVNVSVNDNDNVSVIKEKEKKKFIPPSKREFMLYAKNELSDQDYKKGRDSLLWKFQAWESDNWTDGNGKKIKNWKSKLNHNFKHILS